MKEFNDKPQILYILPNLFTAASAFTGIIASLCAANKKFEMAIIYIILSLILDGLDGRVARLTKTTSKFGVEFDSLADIIAFGVAPAMLFYFSIGHRYGKIGSLITAMFVVFGAIRLARFNVTTGSYDPNMFIGLPIPTAAVVTSLWIGMYMNYPILQGFDWIYMIFMFGVGLLMVSNIRFPSFKKVDFKKANFTKVLVVLIILFSILYLFPIETAVIVFSSYVLYGLGRTVYTFWFAKNIKFNTNKNDVKVEGDE